VELNFDDESVSTVEFAPPVEGETEGLIISLHELYETSREGEDAAGVPGTDTNGMGTVEYPYGDLEEGEYYRQVVRDINYEINETRSQLEKAKGAVKSLSIAILLNNTAIVDDYSASVRNLVANAIGVTDNYISVERLPFQEDSAISDLIDEQEAFMRSMWLREIIVTVIKALVIVFLVLSLFSLIRRIVGIAVPRGEKLSPVGGDINYLAGDTAALDEAMISSLYPDIDLSKKSEGIAQLEKFIDRDPAAVAQLLRNWLTDDI
jgi:flagellar M-ring protein FliF